MSFQVAVSEDGNGPWSYGSALTTAAGTTITSTTGRYARFKVSMTSDGIDTPIVNDVQITHDGTSGSRVTRWTYDEAGNITEQARVTDAGTETDTRSYNNLNQLTTSSGGWQYFYDLDGSLIEKNNGTTEGCEKWELAWNENARLTQVKKGVYDATPALVNAFTVDYQYDEMGRMLRRDDGTAVTNSCWDDDSLCKETVGESVTEYVAPGLKIQSFLRDGELYTLHCDALGSVRTVTDSEGSVVSQMEFDAYGELLSGSFDGVPGGVPYKWVGGLGVRVDADTGFYYMRNRWFQPSSQSFLSRDPVGFRGGLNLYQYCRNSPMKLVDPKGLQGTFELLDHSPDPLVRNLISPGLKQAYNWWYQNERYSTITRIGTPSVCATQAEDEAQFLGWLGFNLALNYVGGKVVGKLGEVAAPWLKAAVGASAKEAPLAQMGLYNPRGGLTMPTFQEIRVFKDTLNTLGYPVANMPAGAISGLRRGTAEMAADSPLIVWLEELFHATQKAVRMGRTTCPTSHLRILVEKQAKTWVLRFRITGAINAADEAALRESGWSYGFALPQGPGY